MSHDAEKRLGELAAKLRKIEGLCPMTDEEADAAYDAAPEEPLTENDIQSIVESVTSGELASWEPIPDLDWIDEVDLENVSDDAYQLHRNKGEDDEESKLAEDELRREMIEDEDENDEDAEAGGTTPPGAGR